jgi:mycothiol synthase
VPVEQRTAPTVVEVDPLRDDLVEAVARVREVTEREVNPDDPPVGVDETRASLSRRTGRMRMRTWIAFLDGVPVGDISFELEDSSPNAHVASSDWFAVLPRARRRGVGDSLLRAALTALAEEGRTSLLLWAYRSPIRPEPSAYADRLGLEARSEERCSRARRREIPTELIDRWIEEGRRRTDGYRLVQFEAHCPEPLMDAYVEAVAAMEDVPVDDLDYTPAPADASLLRSREDSWVAERLRAVRSMVLAPDGGGAGLTEILVSGHRPQIAWQGDTGVVGAHRGRGLGRWLKAENLRHAEAVTPGFEVIETYNAESNPWMLDINIAMGFRPHVSWIGYQGDLPTALAATST